MILHKCNYQDSLLYTIIDSEKRLVKYPTRYLEFLRQSNRPATTQRQIGSIIKLFCQWVEAAFHSLRMPVDEVLPAVTGEHIVDWINYQRRKGISENTIRNREIAVRQMYEYLTCDEVSMSKSIPWRRGYFTRRQHKKIPRFLTTEQVKNLLSAMPHESQRAAAHFMIDTGVRVSELIRLKRKHLPDENDISRSDNYFRMTIPGSKSYDGNEFKIRDTIITRPVLERVWRYHRTIEYKGARNWRNTDPEKPLFLNTKLDMLSYMSIYKTIKSAWKRAGNNSDDVAPHWLRHTTAYSILRSDLGDSLQDNLLILKGMLGHNSIKSTEIYCNIPLVVMHSINHPNPRALAEEASEIYESTRSAERKVANNAKSK